MPINAAHWTVDRDTKNIRYTGSDHGGSPLPSYATVIEFHRWLGGLADDATSAASDDEVDITQPLPSNRSTDNIITLINGYNIDDASSEHLYDGSIIQDGGVEIYDGIVNFGNADVQIQLIQNGAVLIDDWWNQAGAGLNADATAGISHRFMIKVRGGSPGADIDRRRLIGTARVYGRTYSEFEIPQTARGNNVLALSDTNDLNNATAEGTVATWTTITNTEGYRTIDVDNDTVDEHYYSEWNRDTFTINQLTERLKYLSQDGANDISPVTLLYGLQPEVFRGITHEIAVDTILSGPLSAVEELTWTEGTTASSGQMLATDSVSAPTKVWIQLLTGIVPTDGTTLTGTTSSATVDVNVTVTSRTIETPFFGTSTGSALIGSYGFGVEKLDLAATDTVFALEDPATPVTPPNNVTWTLGGLVHNEDYAFVAPWDGTSTDANGDPAVDKSFLWLNTTLNGASETAVVCTTAIPTWLPASGTFRLQNDEGLDRYLTYDSYTGSTFTIPSTAFNGSGESAAATVGSPTKYMYPTFLDTLNNQSPESTTLSFTAVNNSDRDLVVIVRDGENTPIKQYIATAILGSSNSTTTAIRTTDE